MLLHAHTQANEEQAALLEVQAATIKQQAALVQKLQARFAIFGDSVFSSHPTCTCLCIPLLCTQADMAAQESAKQTQLQALQASLADRNETVAAQLHALQDANAALTEKLHALQDASRVTSVKRRPCSGPAVPPQMAPPAKEVPHDEQVAALRADVRGVVVCAPGQHH